MDTPILDLFTLDTWIISDTHFGHKNIVKYCNRPLNHNEKMAASWRSLVHPSDTVLHLGDLSVWYGPEEYYWLGLAGSLPGEKWMIRGNHDKRKDGAYAHENILIIPEFVQTFGAPTFSTEKRVLFSHAPDKTRLWEWDINIHGHIHNNDHRNDPELPKKRDYRNVSIEVMDYKPVRLRDIL